MKLRNKVVSLKGFEKLSRKVAKTQSEIRKCLIDKNGISDYFKIIKHNAIIPFQPLRLRAFAREKTLEQEKIIQLAKTIK
jgi:hypothetical protein